MASRRFSGVVRLGEAQAKLETTGAEYTLVPYPQQAAIASRTMREMGKTLFGYLEGQHVVVAGSLADKVIYNARLADSDGLPVEDVRLAPGSDDRFAQDIEQYLRKESSEIVAKLNDAGIRTVSALFHRIKNDYDEEIAIFAKYLKVREERLKEFISSLESNPDNRALVKRAQRFPVMRGVSLAHLPAGVSVKERAASVPPKFPASQATPELSTKVDLTVHVTPVKNQGMRGTCVAHAAAACLEADLIRKAKAKPSLNLSEQYLYWACKSIDGAPGEEGTLIEYAVEVLLNGVAKEKLAGGVCTAKQWPYNRLPKKGNESQGPLPAALRKVFSANRQQRALNYKKLKHNSIKALKRALAAGQCVGLSVLTYHFWTDDFAWREGAISLPLSLKPDGAHAICLVGYRDEDESHRDGYFVFKNSWDTTWGHGRPDPGYGNLPYRYVIREAIEAYTVEA